LPQAINLTLDSSSLIKKCAYICSDHDDIVISSLLKLNTRCTLKNPPLVFEKLKAPSSRNSVSGQFGERFAVINILNCRAWIALPHQKAASHVLKEQEKNVESQIIFSIVGKET